MKQFNHLCRIILIVSLLFSLAACDSPRLNNRPASDRQVNHLSMAKSLMKQATKTEGSQGQRYTLEAADHYLLAKETEQANQILSSMTPPVSGTTNADIYQIVAAQLSLNNKDYTAALNQLTSIWSTAQLEGRYKIRFFQVRSEANQKTSKVLEAAQDRINLNKYLNSDADRKDNNRQILKMLNQLTPQTLRTMQMGGGNDQLSGWIAFTHLNKQYETSPEQLARAIKVWRNRYPSHPALTLLENDISQLEDPNRFNPRNIVLLLPLSGPYAPSAKAIRDGFLTSYYQRSKTQFSAPKVSVIDTMQYSNVKLAYQAAVDKGADFVVGPLRKEAVAELAKSRLKTPVIALNTLPGNKRAPSNLFQFGLPPELEALAVVDKAWHDGHKNALVIVPNNSWGARMYEAFADAWKVRGGKVLAHENFRNSTSLNGSVKRLLAVNESESRAQKLRRMGIRFNAEPRRREDADFVFMATKPTFARQIKPLLNFYYASDLPIYATSNIYSGHQSKADQDLNNVYFCDMPWILDSTIKSRQTYRSIKRLWPTQLEHFPRLYALGADAYHLTQQINQLQVFPDFAVSGMTGMLRLNSQQQIERQLLWAEFIDGVATIHNS